MGSPTERVGTAIASKAGGGLLAIARGGLSATRLHRHGPAPASSAAPSPPGPARRHEDASPLCSVTGCGSGRCVTWPPSPTRESGDVGISGALHVHRGRIQPAAPPKRIVPPGLMGHDQGPSEPRAHGGGLAIAAGQKPTAFGVRQFSGASSAQSRAPCREGVRDILSRIARDQVDRRSLRLRVWKAQASPSSRCR